MHRAQLPDIKDQGEGEMKFTQEYSKLENDYFHTIRKNTGAYKPNQIYSIRTPKQIFRAFCIRCDLIKKEEITKHLARVDADCSRDELIKKLEGWYGKKINDFVLIHFKRVNL